MNTLKQILVFVAAIVVAIIALKLIFFAIGVVTSIVTALISIAVFAVLVYVAYLLIRSTLNGRSENRRSTQ